MQLRVVNHTKCEIEWEEVARDREVGPGHFCAGSGVKRGKKERKEVSCLGYTGGLVLLENYHDDKPSVLVGIVSFSDRRCVLPSVNANISFYMDWILDQLN